MTEPEAVAALRVAWRDHAACRGYPPDFWYPERGASTVDQKAVCRACPVRPDCLDEALANRETFGIWGGLSERERRKLRRTRRLHRRTAVVCGTRSGYQRHIARHEPACAACRAANTDYHRSRAPKVAL